jgi:type IV secretory pathway VirJ component
MRRVGAALLLSLLVLVVGCGPKPTQIDAGRFGHAWLFEARGLSRGVLFLFSDSQGWSSADNAAAARLAAAGAVVIGIDLPRYRQALTGTSDACLYLVGDVEKVSRQIQRRQGFRRYLAPILVGAGEGGALAQAMLAQSPSQAVAGAVVVDPTAAMKIRQPICRQPPLNAGVASGPVGFLVAAFSRRAPASGKAAVEHAASSGQPVEIQPLPMAPTRQEALATLAAPTISDAAGLAMTSGIGDLPLVELPAASPGAPLVVVLSGDGGWRDIDRQIAEKLQKHGLSVLGWDSLSYFWRSRTPDEFGRDLARAIDFYSKRWQAPRIALVGYSFGADVLPFGATRLPWEQRRHIVQLSLLGYSGKADFQIHVAGWFGAGPSKAARPAAPEFAQISLSKVQCFYGAGESDSACPTLAAGGAEVVKTEGGHHFDGDYAALAQRIADGLAQRSTGG